MRNRKFRAWQSYESEMLYPRGEMECGDVDTVLFNYNQDEDDWHMGCGGYDFEVDGAGYYNSEYDVSNDVLMDFIFRQDGSNRNIYEGDIVIINNVLPFCGEVDLTYQILHQEFRFVMRGINNNNNIELIDFDFNKCELIGNIYENPELLINKI